MVEVRIRTNYDATAKHLGEVPFDRASLDGVIPLINSWGLRSEMSDGNADLVGQFVLDETGAFFEIVVCDDES